MRGLTVIVAAGTDDLRLRTALTMAAAHAALGGRTRLFLDGEAVALIAAPAADDGRYAAAGLPTQAELIESCLDLGVTIQLCQTGLALLERDAAGLDPRLEVTGLVSVLAALGEDRLATL